MADNFRICVGTVGTGAWVSPDGGESWRQVRTGLWSRSPHFRICGASERAANPPRRRG